MVFVFYNRTLQSMVFEDTVHTVMFYVFIVVAIIGICVAVQIGTALRCIYITFASCFRCIKHYAGCVCVSTDSDGEPLTDDWDSYEIICPCWNSD